MVLNTTLSEILNRALQKEGHVSVKSFYEKNSFSFSYEYLRQIFLECRIPQRKKIAEIAKSLDLEEAPLQKIASQARLEGKIRRHYALPKQASLGKFSEKLKGYQKQNKTEEKLFQWIRQLGDKEKKQVFDYVKYVRKQWKQKQRKGGKIPS